MAELKKFIETDSDNETVDVNGKLNFPKNQYIKDNNYAINLNNSDIWKANSLWFADKIDASNEGLIFPRSDGKWDSLGMLDGQIKLRTGVTMGTSPSGGTTQVIADYVVETGTSGIWTYRKWNSGLAECWGRYTETITHYAGPYGSSFYGYHTSSISFPSGLFITTPNSITYNGDIGSAFTVPAQGQLSTSKDAISCYFLVTGSGSKTCAAELNIKGRWK